MWTTLWLNLYYRKYWHGHKGGSPQTWLYVKHTASFNSLYVFLRFWFASHGLNKVGHHFTRRVSALEAVRILLLFEFQKGLAHYGFDDFWLYTDSSRLACGVWTCIFQQARRRGSSVCMAGVEEWLSQLFPFMADHYTLVWGKFPPVHHLVSLHLVPEASHEASQIVAKVGAKRVHDTKPRCSSARTVRILHSFCWWTCCLKTHSLESMVVLYWSFAWTGPCTS